MSVETTDPLSRPLGILFDDELRRVVRIAAQVGDRSKDEVLCSYSSLMIGMLWADDPTSKWFQQSASDFGVKTSKIYRHRGIAPELQQEIVESTDLYQPSTDARIYSSSATGMLLNAKDLAVETGRGPDDPLGVRHLVAMYFFRGLPSHKSDLESWGFEKDQWCRSFVEHVDQQYASEAENWSTVFRKYRSGKGGAPDATASDLVPGKNLGGYSFDVAAQQVLRAAESFAESRPQPVFESEDLIFVLAKAGTDEFGMDKDCIVLADAVLDDDIVGPEFTSPYGSRDLDPASLTPSPFDPSEGSPIPMTPEFKETLNQARLLSSTISNSETIGVRHLIASILLTPDSQGLIRLRDSGVRLPTLRQKLLKRFTRNWIHDDGSEWHANLIGVTPPTIAGYTSDRPDGPDKLNVKRYATAFATVMAATRVEPPLSIGVFGDWGSGKSFFMRMMREQTIAVCDLDAVDEAGGRLFCRKVVPIEFNAWHYAETNLLASLIHTIFTNLHKAIAGDDDESDSKVLQRVLEQLGLAKQAREKALQEHRDAEKARQDAGQAAKNAAAEAKTKRKSVKQIRAADALSAVRDRVLEKGEYKLDDAISTAETYLDIDLTSAKTSAERSVGTLKDTLDQAVLTGARAQAAWRWLVRAPISKTDLGWLFGVTVLIVVIAVAAVALILQREQAMAFWPVIVALITEAGAVIGMFGGWAKRHLSSINRALDSFDDVRESIDNRLEAARQTQDQQLTKALDALDAAKQRELAATQDLEVANERLAKAEQDVFDSRSSQQIARLIEQRLAEGDYRDQLGIVSTIREDFEKLSRLMKKMRGEPELAEDEHVVDRIVLYIDDLDRCRTDKVIEVLEAIHLLLAFPLFVVVVGVDVRWVANSLNDKYPNHLAKGVYAGESNSDGSQSSIQGASPLDYIEKIFQIPFWLPPMNADTSRYMIGELVPLIGISDEDSEIGIDDTDQDGKDKHGKGDEARIITGGGGSGGAGDPALGPKKLQISKNERGFMLELAGAVGKSPRRLKRFVNSYQVLKASCDALESEEFVIDNGKKGQYREAMCLLAIAAGVLRYAIDVIQYLCGPQCGTLDDLEVYAADLDANSESKYVLSALKALSQNPDDKVVEALKYWAPQVARFSFRAGQLDRETED